MARKNPRAATAAEWSKPTAASSLLAVLTALRRIERGISDFQQELSSGYLCPSFLKDVWLGLKDERVRQLDEGYLQPLRDVVPRLYREVWRWKRKSKQDRDPKPLQSLAEQFDNAAGIYDIYLESLAYHVFRTDTLFGIDAELAESLRVSAPFDAALLALPRGSCRRFPNGGRDELWVGWQEEGLGPAAIRDRWNLMSDEDRKAVCPTGKGWKRIDQEGNGREVVEKALRRWRLRQGPAEREEPTGDS